MLGILGLLAYLWIMGAVIWSSFRVWKEDSDPWSQAVGLAMVGAFVALALAETTAIFHRHHTASDRGLRRRRRDRRGHARRRTGRPRVFPAPSRY